MKKEIIFIIILLVAQSTFFATPAFAGDVIVPPPEPLPQPEPKPQNFDCTNIGGNCATKCYLPAAPNLFNGQNPAECRERGQICCKEKTECQDLAIAYPTKTEKCSTGNGKFSCFDPRTETCENGRSQPKCENQIVCERQPAPEENQTNTTKWCCPIEDERGVKQQCNEEFGACMGGYLKNDTYAFTNTCTALGKPPCKSNYTLGLGKDLKCTELPILKADGTNVDPLEFSLKFPAECTCENSTLMVTDAEGIIENARDITEAIFYSAIVSHCNALAIQANAKCAFHVKVNSYSDLELLTTLLDKRKFKNVTFFGHGLPKGTRIKAEKELGKFVGCDGFTSFISCLVGSPPVFGLGTPPAVKEFCKNAPVGSVTMVSSSVIAVPNPKILGETCAAGKFKCFKCQGNGKAIDYLPCPPLEKYAGISINEDPKKLTVRLIKEAKARQIR